MYMKWVGASVRARQRRSFQDDQCRQLRTYQNTSLSLQGHGRNSLLAADMQ